MNRCFPCFFSNCEKSQKLSELDSQQSKNDQLNIIQSNLTEIKNQLRNELLTEIKVTIKSEVENLKLSLNEENKSSELVRRISDIQEKQNQEIEDLKKQVDSVQNDVNDKTFIEVNIDEESDNQ